MLIASLPPTPQGLQAAARVAGLAYLVIFVLAILANFLVLERLGVKDDAGATAANIAAHEPLYRAAIAAFVAILIADIVVGWALFVVLRPVDADMALLTLLFRAAYTISHVGVVLGLLSALTFAAAPPFAGALGALAPALSYHFHASHALGFTVTLIFFGVHLFLLGRLISRAGYMPRLLGWLVSLAGAAYVADGFGAVLIGDYGAFANAAAAIVIVTALAGEGALMAWLIIRGVNTARFPVAPV